MAGIIIGLIGMGFILTAFFMNEIGKWTPKTLTYELVNAVGSIFLVIYAIIIKSYPFLALNMVWALLSLKYTLKDLKTTMTKKAT
jgi:hypothetical protein